ncbi:MAG TPA: glycosyltransferase family 2 protein [Stellaceae bacterium]|nr:glycosyltransferase family 2 protein [Stellaceae bacterium]
METRAAGFSRDRHRTGRRWLRPPLWVYEQYAPRRLRVDRNGDAGETTSEVLPRIAIVTPTLNRRNYLPATVDSVIEQRYPRLDYRVQDGGSTDGTQDLLASYGSALSWRSEPDHGQADAINRAFSECDGEIMAYLNSDDTLLPGTLFYVARLFQAHPDIDVIYGQRIFIDGIGREIGRAVLPRHDAQAIYWADFVPQETMFWRRRVWTGAGPLDETLYYALDWDFIVRAHQAGFKFLRAPRFLACFRVHDQQKVATMYGEARAEIPKVRRRYLGYEPSHSEVVRNLLPYLVRQFAVHWLYRARILSF